jgi:diguanylate cyclase (GGDEF)-like protein
MGVFGEVDVEQEVANRTAMVRRGDSYTTEFSLADGRVILGRGRSLRGGGYLLLHTDVTETHWREKEKEHRIEELESRIGLEALDYVGGGVNIVDGDFNYLYSNENFQTVYGLDGRLTSPGASFESVVRLFAEKGFYGEGEVEELVSSRMAFVRSHETGRVDVKLPCGRVMNVLSQRLVSGGYLFIHTDVTEERQESDRLRWTDRVTGLPNADEMRARGKERLLKAQEGGAGAAVLQVQIDRFSRINEAYTAAVGDQLLGQVAARIQGAVRGVDYVARGGSYHFVVVAAAPNAKVIAAQIASAIRMVMVEPFNLGNELSTDNASVIDKLRLTCSLGFALCPKDGDDFDQLIHKSGLALQAVIDKGGDACLDFGWEVTRRRHRSRDLLLEAQLREAIETQQLTLYYQPQVSLVDETVVGAEALVRWKHPERGLISPEEFIPMAEETQLIIPMGDWILDEACRQASEWRASGLPDLTMSVNLSPVQFRQPDLVARVRQALERHGLQGIDLELEITESVVIDDVDSVTDTANAIRFLGVSLAMDDFGTGYSALSYLTRLPFQKLKIDQSFIRDPNGNNWPIVGVVIQLARELGMQTIAEGVESREHVTQLAELGCDIAQGYLYSKPLPAADFSEWLVEQSRSSVQPQRLLRNKVP